MIILHSHLAAGGASEGEAAVHHLSVVKRGLGGAKSSQLDQEIVDVVEVYGTLQMALMNSLAAISGTLCDQYGVKVSFTSWS